jgi:hypothetical protein
VNRYDEFTPGEKEYLLSELYVLDFVTKKFTKIPIPYESGQKRAEIYQIKVSEKYIILGISITDFGRIFYFYDQNLNYLYKLTKQDFINMTDIESVSTSSIVTSIMDDNMIFYLRNNSNFDRMAFYNIQEKRVTKYLGFLGGGVYDKTSEKIALLADLRGLTGIYNLDALPVKDEPNQTISGVIYSNNQLEYYSNRVNFGECLIYDTTGKLIANLGKQSFAIGRNVIRVNRALPVGVYLLTIKNDSEQSTYKFVVE